MKKLNLQLGSIKEMLTKEQMKKVSGGYADQCRIDCWDGTYFSVHEPCETWTNYYTSPDWFPYYQSCIATVTQNYCCPGRQVPTNV